jgi:hypothetical protein
MRKKMDEIEAVTFSRCWGEEEEVVINGGNELG